MSVAVRLYHTVGRFVPCDVTVVLLLDAARLRVAAGHAPSTSGTTFAVLDAAAVHARAEAGAAGFAHAVPAGGADGDDRCAVALHGDELVAHAWFARGRVPAASNTGGEGFAGIGLHLPPSIAYVYKVHVAPAWRGRRLAGALIAYGATRLPGTAIEHLVTTTDLANAAFRRTAASLGFERRGWAAEIVLAGRHRFRLPRPLAVRGAGRIDFVAGTPAGPAAR